MAAVPAVKAVTAAPISTPAVEPTSPLTILFAINGITAMASEKMMLAKPIRNDPSRLPRPPRKLFWPSIWPTWPICTALSNAPNPP
jgi:hypothetical protein